MKRIAPMLLLLFPACASVKPLEEPTIKSVPAALIADSGASLYVLEAWDDWLDDGNTDMIFNRIPSGGHDSEGSGFSDIDEQADLPMGPESSSNTHWMGEHALHFVLRHGLSQKRVRLIGHADFQPASGCPMEVTLFNPDAEPRPDPNDARRVGFRVRLKTSWSKSPHSVAVEWEAERLMDGPAPGHERRKPGEFPRAVERIAGGSGQLPLGGTLFMRHPKGDRRVYILLLRIASLKEP